MTDQAPRRQNWKRGFRNWRCIGCGAVRESEATNVRCAQCGDLLEVVYPVGASAGMRAAGLDASGLKELWRQRRTSYDALDESGVWRFASASALSDWNHVITLREGNTPVYELPAAAGLRECNSCTPSTRA